MLAVSKGHILDRGVDQMVLRTLTLSFPHLREAERVEHGGVLVDVVVKVCGVGRGGEECVLRDERPVD